VHSLEVRVKVVFYPHQTTNPSVRVFALALASTFSPLEHVCHFALNRYRKANTAFLHYFKRYQNIPQNPPSWQRLLHPRMTCSKPTRTSRMPSGNWQNSPSSTSAYKTLAVWVKSTLELGTLDLGWHPHQ